MIANHLEFIRAIRQNKKISVRFYSKADCGILDRICAPMDYGLGNDTQDGLNRYWFWDYARNPGAHTLGLLSKEIVCLDVLRQVFDPAEFNADSWSPATLQNPKTGIATILSAGDSRAANP